LLKPGKVPQSGYGGADQIEVAALECPVPSKAEGDPDANQRTVYGPTRHESVFMPVIGWNEDTAILATAGALALVVLFGGIIVKSILRLMRKGSGDLDTNRMRKPNEVHEIKRPDGSTLHVECFGSEDAIPIVLSHGWTLDGSEWKYITQHLGDRFRLIVWDEPGLGRSARPTNRDYSLENLAGRLQAVLGLANGRPAILLGHSIGGMIVLTFCRLFKHELQHRVMGLVLTHTHYISSTSRPSMSVVITPPGRYMAKFHDRSPSFWKA
jgi:alpha/beta hydrolase family protein